MPAMQWELSWLEGGRQAVRQVNGDKGKYKVPCEWTPEAADVDLGPLCLGSEGKVVLRFWYLIKSCFFLVHSTSIVMMQLIGHQPMKNLHQHFSTLFFKFKR